MPSVRAPRLVLLASVLAGVANTALFPLRNPEQVALATDVYYYSARAALRGADFYAVNPIGQTGFRYPPAVVLAFAPHAALGDPLLAFAFQTLLNLAALAGLAAIVVRTVERATFERAAHGSTARSGRGLATLDRALLAAAVFLVGPTGLNLVMGQVNPLLALGLAGGAVLLERDRRRASGAAFGLVALVKLFPALVGVWLLRRRAWRAVAAATATGIAGLAAGALVFGPATSVAYVTETLAGEAAVASFAGGPDPTAPFVTIRRQLAVLAPGLGSTWLLPVGAVVLAPVFAGVNRVVADLRSRLVALQGTLLATLLLLPLEPFYVVLVLFPLLPLLYVLDAGWPRRLVLAGAILLLIPVTWASVTTMTAVLPVGLAAVVRDAARALFSFVLPPTIGSYLVLAGCLLAQHRAATGARGSV
ncbi:glycosyltransferase family 87 protein [Halobacterium hubeiense]|uniref:glycosyltransferase family 87 protein n=1 Tax=Halobacterium hubeiense TaxID=1407499 RepID=UPI003C7131C9